MATVSVAADSAVLVGSGTPPVTLLRRIWLPGGLLQRVRWLMLIAALLVVDLNGIEGVTASAAAGRAWPLAIASLAALTTIWLYAYLRDRFSLVTDLLNAGALVLLGASSAGAQDLAFPIYASAWMRALHGTPRQSARAMLIFIAAFAVGGTLAGSLTTPVPVYVASRSVVAILLAGCFALVGLVLATYERTVARERRLRQASHALAEATDRQTIYAATLSGARDLLAGVDGSGAGDGDSSTTTVELAVGSAEDSTIVAAAGRGAGASGTHLRLDDLPPAGAEALHRGESVELIGASPELYGALAIAPRGGSLYAFPLAGHGTLDGAVLVGTERPLEQELKDDLETLTDLAALAIESQLLLEARRASHGAPASPAPVPTTSSPSSPSMAQPDDAAYDRVRSRLGTAVSAATTLDASSSSHAPWRMPSDLATRVRWIFLALATVLSLGTGIPTLLSFAQDPFEPVLLVALLAPLWLGAWFVYGYRRAAFPLVGDLAVGALLFMVLATVNPSVSQFALFSSMFFRAVYGSRARVALALAIHVAALLAAWRLVPDRGLATVSLSNIILFVVITSVIGGVLHFIAATLVKHERALQRGRILRVSGAHLVAASTRSHVHDATLDGARALLTGSPGATVVIATGSTEDLATVAAAGSHGAHAAGLTMHVQELPESLRLSFRQGVPVDQPRAEPGVWRTFDLEGNPGALYAVPLHAAGQFEGALVAATDAPLDPELKDLLQTLGSLASLALEDALLVETSPAATPEPTA